MSDDPAQPKLGPHGGPRTKGVRSPKIMPSGSRRDYILARLERDGRHDLAEAIREGRASAYSIACELGWTKRAEPIGVGIASANAAKRRQHQLRRLPGLPGVADGPSLTQLQELRLGPGDKSAFASRQELESAWLWARERLMASLASGRRPQAYYEFEFDGPRPRYDEERSTLWRMNLLTAEERDELEADWRADFERAQKADFFHHTGAEVLYGVRARRAHYVWADIPQELVGDGCAPASPSSSPRDRGARKSPRRGKRRQGRGGKHGLTA